VSSGKRHSGELVLALPKQPEGIVPVRGTTLTGIIDRKGDELLPLNLVHRKHCSEEQEEGSAWLWAAGQAGTYESC